MNAPRDLHAPSRRRFLQQSALLTAGLAIAASVGVVMLGVTVWLALAARIAPQMHLFSWGMSIRILIGLSAIALYLPELLLAFSRSILSRQGEFLLR